MCLRCCVSLNGAVTSVVIYRERANMTGEDKSEIYKALEETRVALLNRPHFNMHTVDVRIDRVSYLQLLELIERCQKILVKPGDVLYDG